MKKHWLRGLLLGVSLALLLSGGVALAALRISIAPWCGVCCERLPYYTEAAPDGMMCDDFWTITTSGWGDSELLDITISPPGSRAPWVLPCVANAHENGDWVAVLYLICFSEGDLFETLADGPHHYFGWGEQWTEDDYGEWTFLVEGASGAVEADFYFAEDAGVCRAMEFVPEPGSILLLGSGLMGLAGYATLRWRTRE